MVFCLYWFITAQRTKRVAQRQSFSESLSYRIPFLSGAILLWSRYLAHRLEWQLTPHTHWTPPLGAFSCVCGLAVSIWARRTLAGNWSSNVTFKLGHELVTRGPYRFVRHPIYTGVLLMCLATPISYGLFRQWLGLALCSLGLWIKLKHEETLMLQHFPEEYPAYRKQVKALVPFII